MVHLVFTVYSTFTISVCGTAEFDVAPDPGQENNAAPAKTPFPIIIIIIIKCTKFNNLHIV
jgi:hypothetical protein